MKKERTTRKYALQKNGEKRLELSIGKGYKNLHVYLDGELIDNGITKFALLEGETVYLPEGDLLHLKLQNHSSFSGLMILFNGQPLPNSLTDPDMVDKRISQFQYITAILLLFEGYWLPETDFSHHLIANTGDAVTILGFLFILVGLFYKKSKKLAVIISFILQAVNMIVLTSSMLYIYLNLMIVFIAMLIHIRRETSTKHTSTHNTPE